LSADVNATLFDTMEEMLWRSARSQWVAANPSNGRYKSQILREPESAAYLWSVLQPMLVSRFGDGAFEATQVVSISKDCSPILRHVDNVRYEGNWKLLVYANDAENGRGVAGTRFFDVDGAASLDVDFEPGGVVLFDMRLQHEGLPLRHGALKRTLGLRLRRNAVISDVVT